jgi:mono/diheme cytochrome c family protein
MTMNARNIPYCLAGAIAVLAAVAAQSAEAQSSMTATGDQPTFSAGPKFQQTTGEAIYQSLCQGCHMPQGEGAKGAGTYPSLARNNKLEAGGYAVYLVVNGQRGMPPFGEMMTDAQVAEVVNYVRTHFGNNFTDAVTATDVKQVRR